MGNAIRFSVLNGRLRADDERFATGSSWPNTSTLPSRSRLRRMAAGAEPMPVAEVHKSTGSFLEICCALRVFVVTLPAALSAASPLAARPAAATDRPRITVPKDREYYPVLSRRLGESGRVLLEFRIGANRSPENVSVVLSDSGLPYLEAAAIRLLEDAHIESKDSVSAEPPSTWSLAVIFELDSCGKLASPAPQATVVRLCSRRSAWVPDVPPGLRATPAAELSANVAIQDDLRKAEQGDHEAQRSLCSAHVYWDQPTGEHPEKWCEIAARAGDPYAEAMLADLYFSGRGVALDYERAFELYKDAAAHDLDFAQMVLGALYILGRGVDRNPEVGLQWLRRSMEAHR